MSFHRVVFVVGLLCALPAATQAPPSLDAPQPERIDARGLRAVISANGVSIDNVTARIEQGRVTLTGQVPSYAERERAEEAVSRIRGVTAVSNQLVVAAPRISDDALRASVERALKNDPATDEYQVTVMAQNGVARLSGRVDSFQEKILAQRIAGRVEGVRDVDNQLQIRPPVDRNDAALSADVQQRLRMDARLDDDRIKVGAAAGKVVLWGEVNSLFDKGAAIAHAFAAGARVVDSDGLHVEHSKRAQAPSTPKHFAVGPGGQVGNLKADVVGAAIKAALIADPRVKGHQIDVDVKDGTATLSGIVDNLPAKLAALDDARAIAGISETIDHINVAPRTVSDAVLKEAIGRAILRERGLQAGEVNVDVAKGRVTLRGRVDSYDERRRAIDAASAVAGVVAVDDSIEIERMAAAKKSDVQLAKDIHQQLVWSPYVDADDVSVSVADGVAVLTGDVDSWFEKEKAEEYALQAGAFRVDNKLRVAPGAPEKPR